MKKLVSFKHFVIALAMTFAGLATFSACQDKNYDFDAAHSITSYEKFSDVFIKSFGQPQEGHQWGFDKAGVAMTQITRSVIKPEQVDISLYGTTVDITQKEHDEVSAWFANHRVTWLNNPCVADGEREAYNSTAYVISTDYAAAGYGSLTKYSENVLGDYPMGQSINFNHGFVQNVYQNRSKIDKNYFTTLDGKALYKNTSNNNIFRYLGNYIETDENGTIKEDKTVFEDNVEGATAKIQVWGDLNPTITTIREDNGNHCYKINNPGYDGNATYRAQMAYVISEFAVNSNYILKFRIKGNRTNGQTYGHAGNATWFMQHVYDVQVQSMFGPTTQTKYDTDATFTEASFNENWSTITVSCRLEKKGSDRIVMSFGDYYGDIYVDDVKLYIEGGNVVNDGSNLVFYKVVDDKFVLYRDTTTGKYYREYIGEYVKLDDAGNNIEYADNGVDYKLTLPGYMSTYPVGLGLYRGTVNEKGKSGNMDYLECWDLVTETYGGNHLNEFNADEAWGWGRQPSSNSTLVGSDKYNALLVTNADIDDWTYYSSYGSNMSDKYLLVYLKGDDYEGWYLGFDHEAYNTNAANQRIYADGLCNDWIIKLSAATNVAYLNSRIMCEDLGGREGFNKSDIDYNDIVLDVESKNEKVQVNESYSYTKQTITLKLQAAGGTLPLIVSYDGVPLFETHAFFESGTSISYGNVYAPTQNDNYKKADVDYSVMYNTGIASGTVRSYVLYTGTEGEGSSYLNNIGSFDLSKLSLKVYRFTADDYKSSGSSVDPDLAVWVDLDNQKTGVPVKFCVPNTVRWLKERESIDLGYPKFNEWVGNSTKEFWTPNDAAHVVSDHLY